MSTSRTALLIVFGYCCWCSAIIAQRVNVRTSVSSGFPVRYDGQSVLKPPRDVLVLRASSTSVVVTWADGDDFTAAITTLYQVSYRPLNEKYDLIQEADSDKRAILVDALRPATRYRLHVTALVPNGRSNHSQIVLFDTDAPRNDSSRPVLVGRVSVRPEEAGIVIAVLALWIFVIALFFNKWGKIRMLEPYQPQYKHPRQPSCISHGVGGSGGQRLSMQLAAFTSLERERLLYTGPEHVHCAARPRQNSVFVGNPYVKYTLAQASQVSRKVKSAEDINQMVLNATAPAAQHQQQQQHRLQMTNV